MPHGDPRPGGGRLPSKPPPYPDAGSPSDLLYQVNYRRGVLLLSVGIKEETARGLAADWPIGEVPALLTDAR